MDGYRVMMMTGYSGQMVMVVRWLLWWYGYVCDKVMVVIWLWLYMVMERVVVVNLRSRILDRLHRHVSNSELYPPNQTAGMQQIRH